ncbi:MAG: substrate binding domain-containing protein, partial [Bdellovibrionia bacterium]
EVFFCSFREDLAKALPGVMMSADLSNEIRDFRKDEIDFAIRSFEAEDNPDLVARYLGKLRDVVVCAPRFTRKHPSLRSHDPGDPKVLSAHECILSTTDERWNTWTLSSAREEIQVRVTGKLTTNQYTLARRYALEGLGIARLPYYMVSEDLKSGELMQLFPQYEIATHPIYLVYPKGTYTPKRTKTARDAILHWFKKHPEIFLKAT